MRAAEDPARQPLPPLREVRTPEQGAAVAPRAAAPAPAPALAAVAALHPKDAEFDRLTGPLATPAMLSEAWALHKDCRNEAMVLSGGVQTSTLSEHRCGLAPGKPDAATVKRMLEARVRRADFGAWIDVASERTGAFADDPARWRELVAEAYRTGKAKAEPTVMAAESQTFLDEGKALHAAGRLAEAQAAYRQAATYAVASAVGTAWENQQRRIDLSTDKGWQSVAPLLAAAERSESITAGTTLAQNWRRPS